MMNYFRKPLFTLLTIGVLATACEGTEKAADAIVAATPPAAGSGTVATDPTVAAPVAVATVIADVDADGFGEDVDCDDNNPNVNPGVLESPFAGNSGRNGNGIDDNCDNEVDEADCDCDDFKGFRLPGSDVQADATSETDAVADPEATDSEVSAVETDTETTADSADGSVKKKHNRKPDNGQKPNSKHRNGHRYNKQCTERLEEFKAIPGWDCVETPEGKGPGNGHGQQGQGNGRGHGQGSRHGQNHGQGNGRPGNDTNTDVETGDDSISTTEATTETTAEATTSEKDHINGFSFGFTLIDKSNSDVNSKNRWNDLSVRITFKKPDEDHGKSIECSFSEMDKAKKATANTGSGNGTYDGLVEEIFHWHQNGAAFDAELNIDSNTFEACKKNGTFTSLEQYIDYADLANIQKVSFQLNSKEMTSLGIQALKIKAIMSGTSASGAYAEYSSNFYDNPAVEMFINSAHSTQGEPISDYPNQKYGIPSGSKACLADNLYHGFMKDMESGGANKGIDNKANNSGADEQGIKYWPVSPMVVFTPNDVAVRVLASAATHDGRVFSDSGTGDKIKWAFEGGSTCSDDERYVEIFDALHMGITRAASFYTNAIDEDELKNGGYLSLGWGTNMDSRLTLDKVKVTAVKAWSTDGNFKHYKLEYKGNFPVTMDQLNRQGDSDTLKVDQLSETSKTKSDLTW